MSMQVDGTNLACGPPCKMRYFNFPEEKHEQEELDDPERNFAIKEPPRDVCFLPCPGQRDEISFPEVADYPQEPQYQFVFYPKEKEPKKEKDFDVDDILPIMPRNNPYNRGHYI